MSINSYSVGAGRLLKTDGSVVNAADGINTDGSLMIARRQAEFTPHGAGVSIAANGSQQSTSFILTKGYDSISVGYRSDANHPVQVEIWWYPEGTNDFLSSDRILDVTSQSKAARMNIIAPRFKINLVNKDTAAAHVMRSWAFLFS